MTIKYCWLDKGRICERTCVAYNPEGGDGPSMCLLLDYFGSLLDLLTDIGEEMEE